MKKGVFWHPFSCALNAQWVPDDIDLIICAHAHLFITPQARAKARHGALGYHPSLLPRHRGRDAIHWTLHMRDPITGGTAYWLDDGADTGDIAAQDWCWTKPRDTPLSLWLRELAPMGIRLIRKVLSDLDQNKITRYPQPQEHATWEPSYRPKSFKQSISR